MAYAGDAVTEADALSGAVAPDLFRYVLGHFSTGVTVVSAMHLGEPVGLTVASFFSVSLDPPLVGFCAAKSSTSWPNIKATERFCVNVLAAEQEDLCRRFAVSGAEKFRDVSWTVAPGGSPKLADVLAWIDCDIAAVHDAGDHEICVGRVRRLGARASLQPLLFFRGRYQARYADGHRDDRPGSGYSKA
jgi:3-hydroxy-9,10-secoandrosta-1,3,5(10)-triene-9,17-dione monooxygenase reductase component